MVLEANKAGDIFVVRIGRFQPGSAGTGPRFSPGSLVFLTPTSSALFQVDVVPTGAAARSKLVEVGDQLIATSAGVRPNT